MASRYPRITCEELKKLMDAKGSEDLVIVDTDDVLLVCRRDRSQEVKVLVDHLKQSADGQNYL